MNSTHTYSGTGAHLNTVVEATVWRFTPCKTQHIELVRAHLKEFSGFNAHFGSYDRIHTQVTVELKCTNQNGDTTAVGQGTAIVP